MKTKDAATDATKQYLDTMQQQDVFVKQMFGDGAGELGRSGRFQRMLRERHVQWQKSPPYTPQSNGIAERAIKSLMYAARSSLIRSGRDEKYWFFAVADAAFKSSGMPHEYLGGETPHERLTGKSLNYDRLRPFGIECYVHQFKQQRGSGSKFHPYAKRGFIVGHDRSSTAWYVWLTAEEKLVTSAHVSFTESSEATDFLEHVLIDDGEDGDETAAGADTAGADTAAPQSKASEQQSTPTQSSTPPQHSGTTQQTSSRQQQDPATQRLANIARRSARLNRLAQSPGHRTLLDFINSNVATASNTQHADDYKAMLVQRLAENEEAYCFIGMNSTVPTAEDEPTLKEAMAGPYAKEWQAAIDSELTGM